MLDIEEIIKRNLASLKSKNSWIKTFEDLNFKPHELSKMAPANLGGYLRDYNKAKQAKIDYEDGNYISILLGGIFYSNGVDTYEVYTSKIPEPFGYMSKDEVSMIMVLFQMESPKLLMIEKVSVPQIQNMFIH